MDEAIERIENLKDGYGVKDEKSLPYAPMIPVLTALIYETRNRKDKANCNDKIKKWYWSAVFTNVYSQSADNQMTTDFKEIKKWFENDNEKPKTIQQLIRDINVSILDLKDVQSWSNAQYRGVMSLVALEGAKDFETSNLFELARRNDKDHIFSKKMGGEDTKKYKYINSVLNMTWLSKETNIRKGMKAPSKYTKEFIEEKYDGNEDSFLKILKTHLIDLVSRFYNNLIIN